LSLGVGTKPELFLQSPGAEFGPTSLVEFGATEVKKARLVFLREVQQDRNEWSNVDGCRNDSGLTANSAFG
jgi:hypothetical protein